MISISSITRPKWFPPSRTMLFPEAVGQARLTDSHDDEEAGQEATEINNSRSGALHKIIRIGRTPAYPVWQGRDYVGCNNDEGEVVVKEGGRENN